MLSCGEEWAQEVQRWLDTVICGYDLKYIPSTGEYVEIIRKEADKGKGLLRLASLLGVITAVIGFVYGIFVIVRRLVTPDMAAGYSSLMAVMLFIGGIIMLLLGLLGEYLGRVYICLNNAPQFVIRSMVNMTEENMAAMEASMGHDACALRNRVAEPARKSQAS